MENENGIYSDRILHHLEYRKNLSEAGKRGGCGNKATLKPPFSHPKATPKATLKPPFSHPKATPKATPKAVKESKVKDSKEEERIFREIDLLKLDELQKTLKQQFSWIEIIQKNNNISEKSVFEWIDKFISYLLECGEDGKTMKDGKSHFSRWIKIQLKNKPKEISPSYYNKLERDICPPEQII